MRTTSKAVLLGLGLAACSSGCMAGRGPAILRQYERFNGTSRVINPADYIAYLKENVFTHGELDHLPSHGIILHDSRVESFLEKLGYAKTDYRVLQLGMTDPSVLYVVAAKNGRPAFLLNGGLPGAGGIATQAGEMAALGTRWIVHIGTAGVLGREVGPDTLILGAGSYKDGGAYLLSDGPRGRIDPLARADSQLTAALAAELETDRVPFLRRYGFTVPVFYFQPSGLMLWVLRGRDFPAGRRPQFVEMEEASFFEVARRMNVHAASMVAGTDRYEIAADNTLSHTFIAYDSDALKLRAVGAAISSFNRVSSGSPGPN